MERRRSHHRPVRAGFTMIELLVVILIIAALVAILLPTVNAAFRRAKEAQVSAEMNTLATALASFKTAYGDFPPSRVLLSEIGYNSDLLANVTVLATGPSGDTNSADMTVGQLAQRSLLYMRRFFPRADFNTAVAVGASRGTFNDFNGDGTVAGTYYIISGSECLTFFLGGIPLPDLSTSAPRTIKGTAGFSKNPTRPFVDGLQISPSNTNLLAPNRTIPNFDFNVGRLIDGDGDGIPSYIDSYDPTIGNQREYAYFSAYGTNQYDPNDVNGYGFTNLVYSGTTTPYEEEDDATTYVERGFTVAFPTSSGAPYAAKSVAPNPYTSGPAALATSGNITNAMAWQNPTRINSSARVKTAFGDWGGQYLQSQGSSGNLPLDATDPGLINAGDATNNIRQRENDNISNFSGGRLQ